MMHGTMNVKLVVCPETPVRNTTLRCVIPQKSADSLAAKAWNDAKDLSLRLDTVCYQIINSKHS